MSICHSQAPNIRASHGQEAASLRCERHRPDLAAPFGVGHAIHRDIKP